MILQSDKSPCARETAGGSALCRRKGKERSICISRAQAKTSNSASPLPILVQFAHLQSANRAQFQRFCSNFAFTHGPEPAKSLTFLTPPCQKCQTRTGYLAPRTAIQTVAPSKHGTAPGLRRWEGWRYRNPADQEFPRSTAGWCRVGLARATALPLKLQPPCWNWRGDFPPPRREAEWV